MSVKYIAVSLLVVLALCSDIKTFKIKNYIVFPFIIFGFLINYLFYGLEGVIQSFAGAFIPIALLIILFFLRMLGAGDIKLFSAIGSIIGPKPVLYVMAYSFLSGGIIAIIVIILRKNGKQRLKALSAYLKSCFLTLSLLPYSDFNNKADGAKFRFSYAIACGLLFLLVNALC